MTSLQDQAVKIFIGIQSAMAETAGNSFRPGTYTVNKNLSTTFVYGFTLYVLGTIGNTLNPPIVTQIAPSSPLLTDLNITYTFNSGPPLMYPNTIQVTWSDGSATFTFYNGFYYTSNLTTKYTYSPEIQSMSTGFLGSVLTGRIDNTSISTNYVSVNYMGYDSSPPSIVPTLFKRKPLIMRKH